MDCLIKKLINRYKTNDPFKIAEGLNIIVRFADFEEGTRGLYYKKLRRRFIVIDSKLDYHWQRLVCAHELGHDRLHPGISRFWLDEQTFFNAGKYERQANRFAVRLLTAGDNLADDEGLTELLQRNSVPIEMNIYYK